MYWLLQIKFLISKGKFVNNFFLSIYLIFNHRVIPLIKPNLTSFFFYFFFFLHRFQQTFHALVCVHECMLRSISLLIIIIIGTRQLRGLLYILQNFNFLKIWNYVIDRNGQQLKKLLKKKTFNCIIYVIAWTLCFSQLCKYWLFFFVSCCCYQGVNSSSSQAP